MREFRFGVTVGGVRCADDLAKICGAAEDYGFDVVAWVDHLYPNRTSPFLGLMAAASVSERLRLSTYILNLGFWNPALLARDVASAVRLTGGRLELGLGGGIVKEQFDDANLPFDPFRDRMSKIADVLDVLDERLAQEEDFTPPPVLIGGTSKQAIRLAAERADIASFGGRFQLPGEEPGTMRIITADEAAERSAYLWSIAGDRADDIELNAFVLEVQVTDDRRGAMEQLAAEADRHLMIPDVDAALESPFMLIGTEQEIADQILANRERYGFSYITIQRPYLHAFGPIIERVRKAQ
jgi:probable F420-dependent oxidoreductase